MLCNMCPRKCNVNRTEKLGFCQENDCIRIAKIIPIFILEEPFITGEKGALAIFFSIVCMTLVKMHYGSTV